MRFQSRFPSFTAAYSLLAILSLTGMARANDTEISYGGSPYMLIGQTKVSMESEVVNINLNHKDGVKVDCVFVFKNHGPRCKVRIGFPDQNGGGYDEATNPENRATTGFTSFVSYVDGKLVKTGLVKAGTPGNSWHVKTVTFPAGGSHVIRDVYTVPVGSTFSATGHPYHTANYILHTGAAWYGVIGRSEVIVTVENGFLDGKPRFVPLTSLRGSIEDGAWPKNGRNVIVYDGPARVSASGHKLRFVRTNWKPGRKDDLDLYFRYE